MDLTRSLASDKIIDDEFSGNSGVYAIINNINGRVYIGESAFMMARICDHRQYLRRGAHINKGLQSDFDIFGEAAFSYVVLEYCMEFELRFKETFWVDFVDESRLYNIAKCNIRHDNLLDEIGKDIIRRDWCGNVTKEELFFCSEHFGKVKLERVGDAREYKMTVLEAAEKQCVSAWDIRQKWNEEIRRQLKGIKTLKR